MRWERDRCHGSYGRQDEGECEVWRRRWRRRAGGSREQEKRSGLTDGPDNKNAASQLKTGR